MKSANKQRSLIAKLGIGCVVCLLLGFGILLYAQEKTKSEFIGTKPEMKEMKETNAAKIQAMTKAREQAQPQRNRSWGRQNRGGRVDFGENAAFYKTIIDNNLFRPLGWTPPNNEPSYSLVGAKVVDPNEGISQATLLERRSNRYHFVTIGTKVGDMTVKDIQKEEVTLDKAGETITLKQNWELQLLTAKRERGGDRGGERGESGSERAGNNNERNRGNQAAERREQAEQRERANAAQNRRREMMERMRNASPEERRRMIERFRGGRGDGRRGRGRDR
ncbi:hypothetical protein C6503_11525 [Candidatus Poribacteria bacterium]|nr:MAG: hypothetical protein C6503_11525 [Candidatus Poribacteria bacterium]